MNAFKKILRWIKENPLFWLNIILFSVSFFVIIKYPKAIIINRNSDAHLRVLGTLLQLIGIYTVWYDLTKSARSVGKGKYLNNTIDWVKKIFRNNAINGTINLLSKPMEMRGHLKTRTSITLNSSLSEKIEAIQENLNKIDNELDVIYNKMDTLRNDIMSSINSEKAERVQKFEKLNQKIEDITTGNVSILAFGLVWLAIGVIISSLAPEIAQITR